MRRLEIIGLDIDEPRDLERFTEFVIRARASTELSRTSGSGSLNEHDNRALARINEGETYRRLLQMRAEQRLETITSLKDHETA